VCDKREKRRKEPPAEATQHRTAAGTPCVPQSTCAKRKEGKKERKEGKDGRNEKGREEKKLAML
jgi:hypothetical protein